jgi:hypothetical protein
MNNEENIQKQTSEVEQTTLNNPPETELKEKPPTPFDLYIGYVYDFPKREYRKGIVENSKIFTEKHTIKSIEGLLEYAKYDHSTILFNDDIIVYGKDKRRIKNPTKQELEEKGKLKKNYRDGKNYNKSNALFIDVDNDFTENENDWITPEKFIKKFKQYEFYIINSKSHNIEKKDNNGTIQKPRPKFHAYFPLGTYIDNADVFINYLKKLTDNYSFFDQNLKDKARFLYGNNNNLKNSFGKHNQGKNILNLLNTLDVKSGKSGKKETTKTDRIINQKEIESVGIGKRHYTLKEKGLELFYMGYNTMELLYPYLLKINEGFNPPKEINVNEPNEITDIINWIIDKHPDTYKNGENTYYYTPKSIYTFFENRGYIRCRNNNGNEIYDTKNQTYVPEKSLKQETTKHLCKFWYDEYSKSNISLFWLGDDFNNADNPYYTIDYRPDLQVGKTNVKKKECFIFNTFNGFKAKPIDTKTDCGVIYNHIKHRLCSDNETHYTYFLNWIANLIQNPAKYCGTEIILKSKTQGTGKGIFAEIFLGEKIIGDSFSYIGNNEIANDKFTSLLENKILINFDEVGAQDKSQTHSDNIKSMITARTRTQRFMKKDPVDVPNYLHLITTTNKDWAKRVELSDRRTFMPKMTELRMTPDEATEFLQAVENENLCNQFMYDMSVSDLSNVKLDFPPYSEVLNDQKIQSLDLFNKFILNLFSGHIYISKYDKINVYDFDDNHIAITKHDFREIFCKYNQNKYTMAGTEIEKRLKETFGDNIKYNTTIDANAAKYRSKIEGCIPVKQKSNRLECFIFIKETKNEDRQGSFSSVYADILNSCVDLKGSFSFTNIINNCGVAACVDTPHIVKTHIENLNKNTLTLSTQSTQNNQPEDTKNEKPKEVLKFASAYTPKSDNPLYTYKINDVEGYKAINALKNDEIPYDNEKIHQALCYAYGHLGCSKKELTRLVIQNVKNDDNEPDRIENMIDFEIEKIIKYVDDFKNQKQAGM